MPAPAHVQAATLDKFLTAWKNQAVKDTIALWSDDFKQQLLPCSLAAPSHTRAEAEMGYPKLMGSLRNWKVHKPSSYSLALAFNGIQDSTYTQVAGYQGNCS